jgi:hypothetical protein
VYGAKWSVCTATSPCIENCDIDEVSVWVFAIPIMRKDDGDEFGREKREARDCEEAAMWSSSSRTRMLRETNQL